DAVVEREGVAVVGDSDRIGRRGLGDDGGRVGGNGRKENAECRMQSAECTSPSTGRKRGFHCGPGVKWGPGRRGKRKARNGSNISSRICESINYAPGDWRGTVH